MRLPVPDGGANFDGFPSWILTDFFLQFRLNFISDWEEKVQLLESDNITGYVASVGSIESAYMFQFAPAIVNYSHSDLAALMTVVSYLTQLEVC